MANPRVDRLTQSLLRWDKTSDPFVPSGLMASNFRVPRGGNPITTDFLFADSTMSSATTNKKELLLPMTAEASNEATIVLSGNIFDDQGLATSTAPIVARANFKLADFGIFYGEIGTNTGTSVDTVRSWNIDTLVVANRRALNGLDGDTFWASGSLGALKSTAYQDVFARVSVGKIDRNLSTFRNADSSNSWVGAATSTANATALPMPLLAPVTKAIFPFNDCIIYF